jgi:diaminopimelate decarboxylase
VSEAVREQAVIEQFEVCRGELVVGGIALMRLAAIIGRTPFYAYDRGLVDRRVEKLRRALPAEVRLHYAMKANPMPALVAHLADETDGIDVASVGEMRVALDAGVDPADISFAGPGKSNTELSQAVAAGILINVESFREVDSLADIARSLALKPRVAVRVNPDFELKASGMKMGGGPKPFGVDAEDVPILLQRIGDAAFDFAGFHVYAGSQNLSAASICDAQQKSYDLVLRLQQHAPGPVQRVNLGGGFGIPYFPGDSDLELDSIGDNLRNLVARAGRDMPGARLVIELGRYLVGEAGIYVCRIVDRKISRGHVFLITDGGLHHHLAASGNFGQVIRRNYPLAIGNRMNGTDLEKVSVVGPLCTPLDMLGDRVDLPRANPGDLVVVFQSGAYGATASPQQFLSHPPPIEALV